MTRKHFEAIARAFKAQLEAIAADPAHGPASAGAVAEMAGRFCAIALADNANFDADRFKRACGL